MTDDLMTFANNYVDRSTETGFQFDFVCGRCQGGYKTNFQPSTAGVASSAMNAASSFLGGFFNKAADLTERVKSAGWQQAWDKAFQKSKVEAEPHFRQCPKCQNWVCREKCWSEKKGICKDCAPDLGVEMAAAQASKSVEEVWAHAAMAEEDKKLGTEYWREGIVASCPKCEASLEANVKFCPECGANVKPENKCKKCGEKLQSGAKFCGACGEKV